MKSLPADQLAWAMDVTMEDAAFPLDFRHPTVTPPIKDFNPQDYAQEGE